MNSINSIRLNIDGLEFAETQDKIRNQLEGMIGIRDVSFHEGQNYVDVAYDEQTTFSDISNHLQNNGYKVLA